MNIQCTKKLLTELKVQPAEAAEEDPLFSWHANLMMVNRRKTLVLMNDRNRYGIVLHGLKAKDFKRLNELIPEAIERAYREEGVEEEVIQTYLSQVGEVLFTKTKDRTFVARLNKTCELVSIFDEKIKGDSQHQSSLTKKVNRMVVGEGKQSLVVPNEELYRNLEELAGQPIFPSEAMILHVKLEINKPVWRRIAVPKRITFPQLHKTLQIAFNWQDAHLHEFLLFQSKPFDPDRVKETENRKPVLNLVSHQDALNDDKGIPMKLDKGEKVADYLPAEMMYIYDFGDDWRHRITVEKMVDDYAFNHPLCLEGEGDTPPEDIGGEGGYEMFLEVMADPAHEDHDYLKSWSESQGYRSFTINWVNVDLKSI
ncbi:plasmid pRiA4b ORF-3 family protein [Jeotgalibacillus proteolyticus]|uniref:plasmid pRiA4b ORF-3 family protein n=1 Tax=Jeotgalibacillus proteolyticus TaxID=2082395 RepID=UPI003CFA300A